MQSFMNAFLRRFLTLTDKTTVSHGKICLASGLLILALNKVITGSRLRFAVNLATKNNEIIYIINLKSKQWLQRDKG